MQFFFAIAGSHENDNEERFVTFHTIIVIMTGYYESYYFISFAFYGVWWTVLPNPHLIRT